MEPGKGVGRVEACEALDIGPVGEGTSPAGGGLVGSGPVQVMSIKIAGK